MVVVGGRAPANRWGSGSLQELDQPPIIAPIAKSARTLHTAGDVLDGMHDAFAAAGSSHRGPVFVDVPMDEFFNSASGAVPIGAAPRGADPDPDALAEIAELLGQAPAAPCCPRHRRVGRRRRGGRAAVRRGRPASPPSPTAWAAASSRAVTRSWSPRPAARRSAAPTWSSSWAPRSTSGSATASSAARTVADAGPGRATSPTPPARSPATPTSPASVERRPHRRPRRSAGSPASSSYAGPTGRPGSATCRTP